MLTESNWVQFLMFREGAGRRLKGFQASAVRGPDFRMGSVTEIGMGALVVSLLHPFQGRQLDVLEGSPRSRLSNQLGFAQGFDGLGEGVDTPIGVN